FKDCRNLAEITLPDSLTLIDTYAFAGCISLADLEIPDSVTAIGSVKTVVKEIPGGIVSYRLVEEDQGGSFSGCTALANIRLSKNVEYIYPNTFTGCISLNHVEIPDGVKTIGTEAFKDCRNLADLEIPDSVTAIGSAKTVVKKIPGLLSFYDLVEEDQGGSFSGCTALANIRLPQSLTKIYPATFENCSGLNHIVLPPKVTSVGDGAFSGCTGLTSIYIPPSVTSLDLDASGLGQSVQNIYGEKGSYAETLATGSSCSFKEEVYCTFDANGGTVGEKKRLVLPGDLYRELPVPVKGNDKFLGWYTAANGGENVTANTKVTSEQSHTLYARWETAGTSGETQTPGGNDGAESGTKNPPGENPETKDNETSGGNSGNNGTSGGSGSNGTSGSSGSSGDGTDTPAGGSQKQAQTITASSKTAAYKSKPFSLKATAGGGGKLTYKSSNTKVAAVSSTGKVTVKNYGQATITIKAAAKGNYLAATKKITVKVVPKTPALKKVGSSGKKKISASWGKDKTADGYQMYISLQKDFKKGTYERTYKKSAGSMALTGLKSKKTYYIKLRSYKKVGKKKYYSAWSKVKNVKVK
ncbi:MAG TPA: hypothetical protein DF613_09695, partial [Lachnospiraceae bacterium]|nr:hypothetical protein [Lachnospiraceae bacterium]